MHRMRYDERLHAGAQRIQRMAESACEARLRLRKWNRAAEVIGSRGGPIMSAARGFCRWRARRAALEFEGLKAETREAAMIYFVGDEKFEALPGTRKDDAISKMAEAVKELISNGFAMGLYVRKLRAKMEGDIQEKQKAENETRSEYLGASLSISDIAAKILEEEKAKN